MRLIVGLTLLSSVIYAQKITVEPAPVDRAALIVRVPWYPFHKKDIRRLCAFDAAGRAYPLQEEILNPQFRSQEETLKELEKMKAELSATFTGTAPKEPVRHLLLALGFVPGDPALDPYRQGAAPVGEALQASTVVDRIHDAGGLALLAHPGRYRLSFQRLIPAAAALGFDGAEAYYDYAMQPRWEPTPHVCDAIARLLDVHALLRSCGTDTHGLELSGR